MKSGKEVMVGIIGGTLWGNRGAEAMLVSTIGRIREDFPEASFRIFSYYPSHDREIIQDKTIEILDATPKALVLKHLPFALICWLTQKMRFSMPDRLLPKSTAETRRCDLMLDISGISFSDGRELYLPFNLLIICPAIMLGVPVVKLSQAVGPFKHRINRSLAKIALNACTKVFGRGAETGEHLKELNLPANKWAVAPDIAFLYKSIYSLTNENEKLVSTLADKLSLKSREGVPVIGISPSSVIFENLRAKKIDYVGLMLKIISEMGAKYHYVFLPNATRAEKDSSRNNDIYVIDLIRRRISVELPAEIQQKIEYVDFDLNTKGSRTLLTKCSAVLTSRFHGMISCLAEQVPVLVMGWGHKYAEVMTDAGLGGYVIDFLDAKKNVADRLKEVLSQGDQIREQMRTRLPEVRARSDAQFQEISRLLA